MTKKRYLKSVASSFLLQEKLKAVIIASTEKTTTALKVGTCILARRRV